MEQITSITRGGVRSIRGRGEVVKRAVGPILLMINHTNN